MDLGNKACVSIIMLQIVIVHIVFLNVGLGGCMTSVLLSILKQSVEMKSLTDPLPNITDK